MIRNYIPVLFFILVSAGMYAQNADITYIDGYVDLKSRSGMQEAQEGDVIHNGDSIITGDDSYAELEQQNLSSITVKPNSIFTIQEREGLRGKETVFSATVGEISYKFGKLLGKEPAIATPSMIAGIRGTELTVYAGEDGSSLIAVKSGKVVVNAQGKSVDLTANEGVEVKAGSAPGRKFTLKGREMNFSRWNKEKYEVLMADPVAGLKRLGKRMNRFEQNIQKLSSLLQTMKKERDTLRIKMKLIQKKKGDAAAVAFYNKNIFPLEKKLGPVYINIRYYSLSALSYRRFILGKLYLTMKERYFLNPHNREYLAFLREYNSILSGFEKEVVPFLNVNDI